MDKTQIERLVAREFLFFLVFFSAEMIITGAGLFLALFYPYTLGKTMCPFISKYLMPLVPIAYLIFLFLRFILWQVKTLKEKEWVNVQKQVFIDAGVIILIALVFSFYRFKYGPSKIKEFCEINSVSIANNNKKYSPDMSIDEYTRMKNQLYRECLREHGIEK
jgi:hypothetical protein